MNEWPAVRFGEDGTVQPFTEPEIDTMVPLMAQHFAPRRFALCGVVRDHDGSPVDLQVIAWGMQTGLEDDSVTVFGVPDESGHTVRGSFGSAELAARVLGGPDDVRLSWVDS